MESPPDVLIDGGVINGSYDVVINGYAYTMDTVDQDLSVSTAKAKTAIGLPRGGAWVKEPEKVSVKITAIAGIPAPMQLVPFTFAFHGYPAKNWVVTNLKISSANTGASLRTYTGDIEQFVNRIV